LYHVIVPPTQPVAESVDEPTVVLLDGVAVGNVGGSVVFTVTLPVILAEVHPFAFFTVSVYEILEPDAPLLKFTVIGLTGKAPSVTVVMPVPEIE
jgi:hypothetical protein